MLKWVVLAIAAAAAVIAVFHSGGAAAGFLKLIFGTLGKWLGVKMVETPMIYSIAGYQISMQVSALSISIGAKIAAGVYAVGSLASSYASKRSPKSNVKPCTHWAGAYYPHLKSFFDEIWDRTKNSKTKRAPDGLEQGGIAYLSSSRVSTGGTEQYGWEIYEGAVDPNGMSMGDGFDKWQLEKKRVLGLDPGGWSFLVVHSHPDGNPRPSGATGTKYGDLGGSWKSKAPEAVIGKDQITIYGGQGVICEIRR